MPLHFGTRLSTFLTPTLRNRYTRFVPLGRTFSQVFDPDGSDVRYEFDVNVRVIKRYGRAGLLSQYEYDSHGQLQKMTAQMDSGPQITKICPPFALDAAAVCGVRFYEADSAVVSLDGPRPNDPATVDTSAFRLGRFGAPDDDSERAQSINVR